MAKLISETGKASVAVSPDGASIIFYSSNGHQIFWPLKDWPELRDYIDQRYNSHQEKLKNF